MKKYNYEGFNPGERLSTKEVYQRLGISDKTWKKNRKDILTELSNIYEYEIEYEGRTTIYHFIKKVGEATQSPRDEAFENAILTTLYFQPMNTAANVARIIQKEREDINSMGYESGTVYEYTRVRMRKWFGNNENDRGDFEDMEDMKERKGFIEEKVWCMLDTEFNDYIEMNQEQIQFFVKSIKDSFKGDADAELKLLSDYDAEVISKKELDESLGNLKIAGYAAAKKAFKAKYGKYPIKVPVYKIFESKLPEELRGCIFYEET